MRILATMIFIILVPTMLLAEFPIGEIPPKVVLKGDLGGRIDGTPLTWDRFGVVACVEESWV